MEDESLQVLSSYYEELGQKWENVAKKIRELPDVEDKAESILSIQQNIDLLITSENQGAVKLRNYSHPSEGKN